MKKATSPEELMRIHDHIQSFPVKESHYTSREYHYLDARLNVRIMYDLYKEKYPNTSTKYKFYLKYFNENFNLSFGRPQKDSCCTCESLMVKIRSPSLNDAAKKAAATELVIHKRRASKFYAKMKESEKAGGENNGIVALTFDFMQNLPLPQIPVQELFYLRQLWVYVFCVHNLHTRKSVFYVYDERTAKKGANEVCSFLRDYIQEYVPETMRELHLYSDSCPGQNKNHSMIRFLCALTDIKRFDRIVHRFPVRGHSYLPCDRDFGLIKRAISKRDRVYVPKEYVELIVHCTRDDKFLVHMVDTSEVLDFNLWWPKVYKEGGLSVESRVKAVPRQSKVSFAPAGYSEFVYSASLPHVVNTSEFIDGPIRDKFYLSLPSVKSISLPTSQACVEKMTINPEKVKDIMKVKKYIPDEHLTYYEDINTLQ